MANRSKQDRITVHVSPGCGAQLRAKAAEGKTSFASYGGQFVERGLIYDDLLQMQAELAEGAKLLVSVASRVAGASAPATQDLSRYDDALRILFEMQKETLRELGQMKAELLAMHQATMTDAQRSTLATTKALKSDQAAEQDKTIRADVDNRVRSIIASIKATTEKETTK